MRSRSDSDGGILHTTDIHISTPSRKYSTELVEIWDVGYIEVVNSSDNGESPYQVIIISRQMRVLRAQWVCPCHDVGYSVDAKLVDAPLALI